MPNDANHPKEVPVLFGLASVLTSMNPTQDTALLQQRAVVGIEDWAGVADWVRYEPEFLTSRHPRLPHRSPADALERDGRGV